MIAAALSYLFPPKVEGRVPFTSVTLALLESGELAPIVLDPPETGVVNVKKWDGEKWEIIGFPKNFGRTFGKK